MATEKGADSRSAELRAGAGRRPPEAVDPTFERLLNYLKESRAFDFTGYKRASLMRRVQHQMRQTGVDTFEEYHDYLQVHPDEFTALFNTILINVTGFFRDDEAWEYLRASIVPGLLDEIGLAPIRVWSAGCASGQEAYSLAMELAERVGPDAFRGQVKIYATDVDEDALAVARQATYTERDLAGLPEGYQDRYFESLGGSRYVFRKELRRSVIFGRNDLVQDAPISRIDLLACRNTLMYFNAETQSRIVSRLGFALRPNGVLFLGKAEMLLNHATMFEPLDLKRRFFRKAAHPNGDQITEGMAVRQIKTAHTDTNNLEPLRTEAFLNSPVPQLVVDEGGRLALLNHRATTLFALSDRDVGRPFQDLEVSFRPAELRSHIGAVHDNRLPVWLRDVEWQRSSTELLFLDIQLVPLVDARSRLLGIAIIFNDVSRYRQLQTELEAANRQLETAYEELQSTNEELETMNEELQSMNDELQATNDELRDRTAEISALNHFMESVLGSLGAGVVVVSREMIVQVWNRQAEDLWGLREDETVGQHFLNLDSGLPTEHLKPLVREVIFDGSLGNEMVMRAVNRRGRTIELRVAVTPLLSGDDEPGGALLLMEPHDGADQSHTLD